MANWPGRRSLSLPWPIKPELEPCASLFRTRTSPAPLDLRTRAAAVKPAAAPSPAIWRSPTPVSNPPASSRPPSPPAPPHKKSTPEAPPSPLDRAADGAPPPSSTSGRRRRSPPPPLPQCPSRLQLVAVVVSKFPLASFYFSPNRSPCLRAPPPAAPPPRGASRQGRQSRLPKSLGEFVSLPSSRRA
jgi:hypothetical protein